MIFYPAKIKLIKKDKSYLVEFPDLPGCLTEGKTLEEAKQNAKDALTGYLASIFERNFKVPKPSKIKGRNIYMIEPEPEVSIPIILRKLRENKNLTQGDIAKVLGISYQAYQRLEKPGTRATLPSKHLNALQRSSIRTSGWNLHKPYYSCYIPIQMKKLFIIVFPAILLLLFSPDITNAENKTSFSNNFHYCSYVIDGDTIIVIIDGKKQKVLLIGVDTPETDGPYTKEEPFGKEASAFTKKITEGKKVRLEYDRQKRDKYGRLLAYVYLEDGTFLNAELIKQGYATAFRKFRFKYRDNFKRYEREARENKRGLWK